MAGRERLALVFPALGLVVLDGSERTLVGGRGRRAAAD